MPSQTAAKGRAGDARGRAAAAVFAKTELHTKPPFRVGLGFRVWGLGSRV